MAVQRVDNARYSPSSTYMELANVEQDWTDFGEIVAFLSHNLDRIIHEVHEDMGKLVIGNNLEHLNCPVGKPEASDPHGSLLLRSWSERAAPIHSIFYHSGVSLRREFRVRDCGPCVPDNVDLHHPAEGLHWIEIQEVTVRAPVTLGEASVVTENVAKVCVRLAKVKPAMEKSATEKPETETTKKPTMEALKKRQYLLKG